MQHPAPTPAGPRFLSCLAPEDPKAARATVGLVGVPYDGAVTYRSGARFGPGAIRAASDSIESYCPRLQLDLQDAPPVDLGDLSSPASPQNGQDVVEHWAAGLSALPDLRLLAVGGDHLVAYPFLAAALAHHPNLQIVHIDAHTDLREEWEGEPFNHASVLRRVLDVMGPDARIHEWGIRSGLRTEFELVERDPRIERLPNTAEAGISRCRELAAGTAPIYVTLDVDGLDPSQLPGTGTPEPAGLSFDAVERALIELARGRSPVVGADLVEIAPQLDPSGVTAVVGARLARTMLLMLRQ